MFIIKVIDIDLPEGREMVVSCGDYDSAWRVYQTTKCLSEYDGRHRMLWIRDENGCERDPRKGVLLPHYENCGPIHFNNPVS